MEEPSETASASDGAHDLFGGQRLDLDESQFGVEFSGESAKPGISQTNFGRDSFDNIDFARAVDSCFKSLETKPFLLPWECRAWKPFFFSVDMTTWMTLPWVAFFVHLCRDLVRSSQCRRRSNFLLLLF